MNKVNNKILSIITNFGCHGKCPYCIVRENGIDVPATTLDDLDNLELYLKKYNSKLVSVSGGGDPLHNFNQHEDWYDKLFGILKSNDCKLEVHTSYLPHETTFNYDACERVVYHLREIEQLYDIRKVDEIVRVVYVVTDKLSLKDIITIANFVDDSDQIDELSFRQMVDSNYISQYYNHEELIYGHKHNLWHYIKQNDYNLYYVEGKIYNQFSEIHR